MNAPLALEKCPWRTGAVNNRTIYAMLTHKASPADPTIGMMDTPALAEAAVTAHNAHISQPPTRKATQPRQPHQKRRG